MNGPHDVRPLHLHTIDSLCADLVSGRPIGIGTANNLLKLEDAGSRAIVNWYRLNRSRWSSPVRDADIEAIVDAATNRSSGILPAAPSSPDRPRRQLRLTRIQAHRFAGLHAYGTPTEPPEDFDFEPASALTLFEGQNGSGKTSILNALAWCLTGQILRPQRAPERAQEEFSYRLQRERTEAEAGFTEHTLTPVTPLPDPNRFRPAPTEPVPIDTWVLLTFVDDDGQVFEVRRSQSRTTKGRIVETAPDLRPLELDPIAFRIGTVMPGLIPHIRLDNASELGQSVAALTGLAALVDLAKHARKVQTRATKESTREKQNAIRETDRQFLVVREDLTSRLEEYPAMSPAADPKQELPSPGTEADVGPQVTKLLAHFESVKARALKNAQDILGAAFDPVDAAARGDLERSTGPARGELAKLAGLKSAARLKGLGALTQSQIDAAQKTIAQIRAQAAVFEELTSNPPLARRQQLYARVAAWLQDGGDREAPDACPVCGADLQASTDPVTGRAIKQHLHEAARRDAEVFGQSLSTWLRTTLSSLARDLPKALSDELDTDLPAQPRDLVRTALTDELFSASCFTNSLAPLKKVAIELCDRYVVPLPPMLEPVDELICPSVSSAVETLNVTLRRISRAIAFSNWRRANGAEIRRAFSSVVGTEKETTSLAGRIASLEAIVAGAAPINAALVLCRRLQAILADRAKHEKRIQEYGEAAKSLAPVVDLARLVEQQVADLQNVLRAQTSRWRQAIYQKTHTAAHDLVDIQVDPKGQVGIAVGGNGASAPAQHVSNASAFRANLVAFFLAFWEHVLEKRGGLRLLLMDDPQDLLDAENRERLSEALIDLVKERGQLIVTTFDREFARSTIAHARRSLDEEAFKRNIEHRAVFPVAACRPKISVPLALNFLEDKRKLFLRETNVDIAGYAQDYVAEVRTFVEARIAALFDDPAHSAMGAALSVSDLMGRLRGKVKTPPSDLFTAPVVVEFCRHPALTESSACLKLLNRAHHADKTSISYMDVKSVQNELETLCDTVLEVHEEFRRWRQRRPPQINAGESTSLKAITRPEFDVEVYRDLAAFTGKPTQGVGGAAYERINGSWFKEKALFHVRCENFGFAAPQGSIAIVEIEPTQIEDHRLVICSWRCGIAARRLARNPHDTTRIALVAQTPDPLKSPPSLILSPAEAQLFRVVGMLFNDGTVRFSRSRDEAEQVPDAPALRQVQVAYQVSNMSALPLALPGQFVLGGPELRPQDLAKHQGKLAAVRLNDDTCVFKRIGPALKKPLEHVRLFESVGYGESVLIQTERREDHETTYPLMEGARLVLGVLYR